MGAEPLGTTNNLNFANPEKEHVAWQLTEAVRGLADATRALHARVVGGNVSLYNEGARGPIYPTPVIDIVGRLPDARRAAQLGFARVRDTIALLGAFAPSLVAASSRSCTAEPLPDRLGEIDLQAFRATQIALRDAVRAALCQAPTTSPREGLAVALAECCLAGAWARRSSCTISSGQRLPSPGARAGLVARQAAGSTLFGGGCGRLRRQRRGWRSARAGWGRARAHDRQRGRERAENHGHFGGPPAREIDLAA